MSSHDGQFIPACKYCHGSSVIKFGKYKKVPRYFCTECGRKFKNDQNLFHMRVSAECIGFVLHAYYSGTGIKDIIKQIESVYGHRYSETALFLWINRFTRIAWEKLQTSHPQVSDTWVLNEMIIAAGTQSFFTYEIVDVSTNYILDAVLPVDKVSPIKNLIQLATEKTNIIPRLVLVYMPISRLNNLKKGIKYKLQHVPKEIYADIHRMGISGDSVLYDIQKYRLKNPHHLKSVKTIRQFLLGLTVHHNFFQPDDSLNQKTPAEAAQINYPCHNWQDLVRFTNTSSLSTQRNQK